MCILGPEIFRGFIGNLTGIMRGHYHPSIGSGNPMGRLPMYKWSRNHHVINGRLIASAVFRFDEIRPRPF